MATPAKHWVPDRRDMIWVTFNPQRGAEMKDEHPMMVLSPKAFNERTGLVIGLPMTHAPSNETNPFAVKFTAAKGEVCYVLSHQPKSFAWRERGRGPMLGNKSRLQCSNRPAKNSTPSSPLPAPKISLPL
jgi:mRNA interferase MazF